MPSKTTNLPTVPSPPIIRDDAPPPPPPPPPSHRRRPDTVIRAALAAESLFNVFLAYGMLLAPGPTARSLFLPPATATAADNNNNNDNDLLTALLTQWIGVWTLATTVPLVLGIPGTAGAAERRRVAYVTLGAMEALWVPLLLGKVWGGGGVDAEGVVGKLVVPMGVCLVWRCWVVFVKPGWLGGAEGVERVDGKGG